MSNLYDDAQLYDLQYGSYRNDIEFWIELSRRYGGKSPEGRNKPVLEFACGTFRVSLALARAGIPVVCTDVSQQMLDFGLEKLLREPHDVSALVTASLGDMRTTNLPSAHVHELAIVPFTAYNHMLTREDQLKALLNIRKHLAPGGYLLADLFNPDMSKLNRPMSYDMMVTDEALGQRLVRNAMSKFDKLTGTSVWSFICEWFSLHTGESLGRKYIEGRVAIITPEVWRGLLKEAGFSIVEEWGSYEYAPFDPVISDRMLFLCRS